MITYNYNNETGMLETILSGEINVKDLTEYILGLSNDKNLPRKLKILTDATKGKFSIGVLPKDMVTLVNVNKRSLAQRDFIYDAFILTGAFEIALGMLYRNLSKTKKYRFNVFSTQEAALDWLNKP